MQDECHGAGLPKIHFENKDLEPHPDEVLDYCFWLQKDMYIL